MGVAFYLGAMAELEVDMSAEAIFIDQRGLRRSARLRKLKENKGKMFSQYFPEPTQSSAQIRWISKKVKRQRDQSRYKYFL